jgi:cell wall-associated NlpC family hydrolase
MKNHQKYLALVTSTLLVSALSAGPATAETPRITPVSEPTETGQIQVLPTSLNFEKPVVKTSPAPVVEVAAPVASEAKVEVKTSTPAPAAPVVAAAPVAVKAAPSAPSAPVPSSGKGAAIAAAAYAQIGVAQDCTALATNSLAAVGINYHGWPAGYLSLGPTVSAAEAKAGDLIYYANGGMGMAHIAVYVGNGMAIHGGWNGGTTALFSANVGSGPVFIRVA